MPDATGGFFLYDERMSDGRGMRILLVDSEPRVRFALRVLLERQPGLEVAGEASDADGLLTEASRIQPDLVLLDIRLPHSMDGYEVCKRVKAKESTRFIPVILITALDDLQAKVRGIEAGADDFLSKPANREEMIARTRALIHVRELKPEPRQRGECPVLPGQCRGGQGQIHAGAHAAGGESGGGSW